MAEYGTYASLAQAKAQYSITASTDDAVLLQLLEAVSRGIDKHCGRKFYPNTETRYYNDGALDFADTQRLWVDDLLSVISVKFDNDRDGVYENTLAATDYLLWPYNAYPKRAVELDENGTYSLWPDGRKAIEIAGVWGYGDELRAAPYDNASATGTVADTTTTSMVVSNGANLSAGQTIKIENELMYLTSVIVNTLTVVRGVNGTTAAAHAAAAISITAYPQPIVLACLMQVGRLYRRRDSSFATAISNPITGSYDLYKGLDPDVQQALSGYMRWA
jgi:hypothetical protein